MPVYIGGEIYKIPEESVNITSNNISEYFTVTNGNYYFAGNGTVFTTNNNGIQSSVAETTLVAKRDFSNISFNYSYSSEQNYDKFTLIVAGTTVENAVSGATTDKSYTGSLLTGQSIVFKYQKDSSQNKNDDKCTFSNFSCVWANGTEQLMKDIAREVNKIYIGVNGVAREVTKAYIGVDGVAREWYTNVRYSSPILIHGGTLSSLQYNVQNAGAATIDGAYAIFAGGNAGTYDYAYVTAYDTTLARNTATDLSKKRHDVTGGSVGNYAVFAGGYNYNDSAYCNTVDAYSKSLTKSSPTQLTNSAYFTSGSIGNYVLFFNKSAPSIEAYNSSLTYSNPATLSIARKAACAKVGNYLVCAGGTSYEANVDAFDSSLTRQTLTSLFVGRSPLPASNGAYAIFAGGDANSYTDIGGNSSIGTTFVESYNSSLTKHTPSPLAYNRNQYSVSGKLGDVAIFACGSYVNSKATVEAYDVTLTRMTCDDKLSVGRNKTQSTTIGNYFIIASGYDGSSGDGLTDSVEYYTLK